MKIVIILGSVRENRKSDRVGRYLKTLLDSFENIEAELLDLLDYSFPVMKERFRNLENPPQGMAEFSDLLNSADGIILVSPEYNGSYSGVLKNTLDYFRSEYAKKPMGIVTVSSGSLGGVNASHHLMSWVLHVKAIPSPYKLMVQNVDALFSDGAELQDPGFESRAVGFLEEFIWLSKAISNVN